MAFSTSSVNRRKDGNSDADGVGPNDVNNDNSIIDNDEDTTKLISMLNDATRSERKTIQQQEYQERLLSFHASTYYAKPACLSPLICARFGWRNADKDMLSCSSCSSALAILPIPSTISTEAMDKLCSAYRRKIATNHKDGCLFGWKESQFQKFVEEEESNAVTMTVIPSYMASVLPEKSVQLIEHPAPSRLVRQQIDQIKSFLSSIPTTSQSITWKIPKLQIPSEICHFAASGGKLLLECDDEVLIALAILGWNPVYKRIPLSDRTVSLGCPLCLAMMDLEVESTTSGKGKREKSRPAKRQRTLAKHCNPLDAHRYYCPYQSGFPVSLTQPSNPVWKRILERLLQQEKEHFIAETKESEEFTEEEIDKSIQKVRQILRAGIAKTTVNIPL
ncbi:C3HC zinc finger-like-domain containing protein [Nitzschia inconspicua]|uniref:C3HC zinc finger-like-domain containing protein n=1 Tax=Nitzschia inconspicua TaxID=303405 RepID=A0A9K3PSG0_9STRA|nr:C3HC zinc finger-like-domain containing protein [Nitzschia inconspicua]